MTRRPDLDLDDAPDWQAREWRWQRHAWRGMLVLLLAIAGGALGRGGMSSAHACSPDGQLCIRYERMLRMRSSDALHIELRGAQSVRDLALPALIGQQLQVAAIWPTPLAVRGGAEAQHLLLAHTPGQLTRLRLDLIPDTPGLLELAFVLDGRSRLVLALWVWP